MKIDGLDWDDQNVEHIDRHNINISEVQDVCFGPHIVIRGKYGRYVLYGQTQNGRYIMVVLEHYYSKKFRTITSREMTDGEKKKYKARIK